ncbi:uncharacterized protein ALTATR162_LOCUS9391 [Alternaria atra]|uniref:ATP-dependent DNA helicase n=1 Tax=Alternaria atra TaxID=119953 RepID=A0A8J2N373_9PLEO|nr:uncharacterized protein ALTATR162_LOCUS9391 [Alternaria atra]CAG5179648.1 unnamed protein product [Alternaria atra]
MIRIVRDFGHRTSQLAWQSRVAIKIKVRRLAFVIVQLRDEVLSILEGRTSANHPPPQLFPAPPPPSRNPYPHRNAPPTIAPIPKRIAQTSTELKKQYKQSRPPLNERQRKQLELDFELDQRAACAREAEERSQAAKKKREEGEAKEARARKQIGVGLATQLIGYSHPQEQLKNDATDMAIDLPELNKSSGEQWADDGLDDDSLLEAHDLLLSGSVEGPQAVVHPLPMPAPAPSTTLTPPVALAPPKPLFQKDTPDFIRTHGPINKAIEAVLDKLPEPLLELLSQDMSLRTPDWDPPHALLHKLNPIGLPPHRLCVKVDCVVSLLGGSNTSSQSPKSQHLRVLRCEKDRLECLVLDGQLEVTKIFLTRVAFHAKYRNFDEHLFQRTQFPIRVAADYTPSSLLRDTSQTGFKLPSIRGCMPPASFPRKTTPPVAKAKLQADQRTGFTLPGLPASKSSSFLPSKLIPTNISTTLISQSMTDGWDDFLESGTQIARELASEPALKANVQSWPLFTAPASITDFLPPMSTQDLDFSLEDPDDKPELEPKPGSKISKLAAGPSPYELVNAMPAPPPASPVAPHSALTATKSVVSVQSLVQSIPVQATQHHGKTVPAPPPAKLLIRYQKAANATAHAKTPTRQLSTANTSKPLMSTRKIAGKCLHPGPFATGLKAELAKLRASQLPKSMTGPYAKRKSTTTPSLGPSQPTKRQCGPTSRPVLPASFEDFGLSTQDAASFFDDDRLSSESPPIPV